MTRLTNRRCPTARGLLLVVLALGPIVGCDDGLTIPDEGALFVLEVSGEQFRARVTDADEVGALEARMAEGVEGVVSGTLARGDGGFNTGWSWHWIPTSVHAADQAIEVCDGRPGFVEEDLDYWVDTVGQFCPWSATVIQRLE